VRVVRVRVKRRQLASGPAAQQGHEMLLEGALGRRQDEKRRDGRHKPPDSFAELVDVLLPGRKKYFRENSKGLQLRGGERLANAEDVVPVGGPPFLGGLLPLLALEGSRGGVCVRYAWRGRARGASCTGGAFGCCGCCAMVRRADAEVLSTPSALVACPRTRGWTGCGRCGARSASTHSMASQDGSAELAATSTPTIRLMRAAAYARNVSRSVGLLPLCRSHARSGRRGEH
jgi:hypothetical protein